MAGTSDYLETKILDHVLRATSYTAPTTVYLALYTSDPGDDNYGTEVSGTNYARISSAFSVTNNVATNSGALEYAAAGNAWGTVTHVGVLDASSSGNLLYHSALTTSKAITTGDIFRIPAGSLTVTMT